MQNTARNRMWDMQKKECKTGYIAQLVKFMSYIHQVSAAGFRRGWRRGRGARCKPLPKGYRLHLRRFIPEECSCHRGWSLEK